MARIFEGSGGTGDQDNNVLRVSAEGENRIELPGNEFISDADMTRDGQDLVLSTPEGSVIVEGYFAADPAPMLAGPHGASLSSELVNSFLQSAPQYAQSATMTDESPVGAVEEIKGDATVTHADGTTEPLTIGSPIYQGDVVQTNGEGAVNIVFVDETSMAVSENARLAIDEYSFDPATESGTTDFSVLRGVFVFTSGLIGRDDPDDVSIDTPVGSIGIRGTIIAGNIRPEGESEITVVEGAIVVKNGVTERTLAVQFETVRLTGFDNDMQDMGVLDGNAIGNAFGSVSDVAPSLFSAINDAAGEQNVDDGGNTERDAADESQESESSGEESNSDSDNNSDTDNSDSDDSQQLLLNDENDAFTDGTFKEATGERTETLVKSATSTVTDVTGAGSTQTTGTKTVADDTQRPPTTNTNNNDTTGDGSTASPPPPLDISPGNSSPGVARISDNADNGIGYTIEYAGDLDGDGYGDFLFSNAQNQNHTYVMHGAANLTNNSVTGLLESISYVDDDNGYHTGELGVIINTDPNSSPTHNETVISSIGDFNGDGYMDYMIGQPTANNQAGAGSGVGYIVSGLDGTYMELYNDGSIANLGASISAIGDIDNDGYDDIIIGAYEADNSSTDSEAGQAYIVFGRDMTGFTGDLDVSGFPIGEIDEGAAAGDHFGYSVEGIGDFNGDGKEDYAIGAPGTGIADNGKVYIYTGANSLQMTVNTSQIGSELGVSIMNLGDVNGDGLSDMLIGTDGLNHQAYVVQGRVAGTSISDISAPGTNEFIIDTGLGLGRDILGGGAAGDFNGDGYNDIAIAVKNGADANIYVIYGNNSALSGSDRVINWLDLNNSNNAFKMFYEGGGTLDFSFDGGDIDGDGFDDLLIGVHNAGTADGEVLIVDGRKGGTANYVFDEDANDARGGVNGTIWASDDDQTLMGDANNNILHDNADSALNGDLGFTGISYNAGGGNDVVNISNNDFLQIDGGLGEDTLKLGGSNMTLDFTAISTDRPAGITSETISGIEKIEFAATNQTIKLTIDDIFELLKTSDTGELKIGYNGVTDGTLQLVTSNNAAGIIPSAFEAELESVTGTDVIASSSGGFETFEIGGYTLQMDSLLFSNGNVDTVTV